MQCHGVFLCLCFGIAAVGQSLLRRIRPLLLLFFWVLEFNMHIIVICPLFCGHLELLACINTHYLERTCSGKWELYKLREQFCKAWLTWDSGVLTQVSAHMKKSLQIRLYLLFSEHIIAQLKKERWIKKKSHPKPISFNKIYSLSLFNSVSSQSSTYLTQQWLWKLNEGKWFF